MGRVILVIVCSLASIWGAYSISIPEDEPVLTSYHPCDLAFIYLKKNDESKWMGYLDFGLYRNLSEVLLKIYFEKEVTVTPVYNPSISLRYDKQNLVLRSRHPIPKLYKFDVYTDTQQVPIVHNLTLNNEILCSNFTRDQSMISLSPNVTQKYNGKYYSHPCGKKSMYHSEILSLRTEAKAGDWPWHVAIFIKQNGSEAFYQCGGSIVSRTAILTAAHCIFPNIPSKDYIVLAGIGSVNSTDNEFAMQNLTVQEIIIHPKHKSELSSADLAIIKVKNIQFTVHVQPICVWGPSNSKSELFGMEATIVGFGENEHKKLNNNLRAIDIMVQKDTTCTRHSRLLNNSTFCAGNGPHTIINVRNGDSGGGLMVRTSQPDHRITWFLRGVLSKCGTASIEHRFCDPKEYVIFTNVAAHYDWIHQNAGIVNASNSSNVLYMSI